jgi:hypothetical protein
MQPNPDQLYSFAKLHHHEKIAQSRIHWLVEASNPPSPRGLVRFLRHSPWPRLRHLLRLALVRSV